MLAPDFADRPWPGNSSGAMIVPVPQPEPPEQPAGYTIPPPPWHGLELDAAALQEFPEGKSNDELDALSASRFAAGETSIRRRPS